jgi:putative acetyltransferase
MSDDPEATPQITLASAEDATLLEATRGLFRDYAASIGVDLCFQNFEAEVAGLPGDYTSPGGALVVALLDGQPAGCGALRPLHDVDYPNACEMKRLFVPRAFRGFGLGRLIAQELIARATQAGYSTMLLDTLDDMEAARGLYGTLGFEEIPPYYYNPIPGAHYLKVDLDAPGTLW